MISQGPMQLKYTILVVDDQRDNLMRIVEMIEEKFKDCEIFHALDGATAIKISEHEIPDLIILDWEMPGLDGIETTRKLKENPDTKDIPVIICTGKMTSSKHLETALNAGAVDYIRKPIDKVELLARIRSMLMLAESYKNIRALSENKDRLLSIIAHDLKNPIYTVKLLMDLVTNQDIDNEKRNHILRSVRNSVASTFSLLQNLLAWANSQRKTIMYLPTKLNLLEIVVENINLLQLDAESKSLSILCNVHREISVYADRNMLSTIIRNLLSNAIKYSPKEDKIEISAFEEKGMIHTTIKDYGSGLTQSDIDEILKGNSQFIRPGTNNDIGSGLGMHLCKEFVKINGGILNIESVKAKGTSVMFSLPDK